MEQRRTDVVTCGGNNHERCNNVLERLNTTLGDTGGQNGTSEGTIGYHMRASTSAYGEQEHTTRDFTSISNDNLGNQSGNIVNTRSSMSKIIESTTGNLSEYEGQTQGMRDHLRIEHPPSTVRCIQTATICDSEVQTGPGNDMSVQTSTQRESEVQTGPSENIAIQTRTTDDIFVQTNADQMVGVQTETHNDISVQTITKDDSQVQTDAPDDMSVETSTRGDNEVQTDITSNVNLLTWSRDERHRRTKFVNIENDKQLETGLQTWTRGDGRIQMGCDNGREEPSQNRDLITWSNDNTRGQNTVTDDFGEPLEPLGIHDKTAGSNLPGQSGIIVNIGDNVSNSRRQTPSPRRQSRTSSPINNTGGSIDISGLSRVTQDISSDAGTSGEFSSIQVGVQVSRINRECGFMTIQGTPCRRRVSSGRCYIHK